MSTIAQLICNSFGGIRRKDAYFNENRITCSDCQNVELFYTELNSGVGIRTSKCNTNASKYLVKETCSIYQFSDGNMVPLTWVGDITGINLSFEDEYGLTTVLFRDEISDVFIDEIQYFAFSNEELTYYTTEETNNQYYESLFDANEHIVAMFNSYQDNSNYLFVYTENNTKGMLYNINLSTRNKELLIDNLSLTGKACGTDFEQGWLDMFCFSNGKEIRYIYSNTEIHSGLQVQDNDETRTVVVDKRDENGSLIQDEDGNIVQEEVQEKIVNLIDSEGREVLGLGMYVYDGRLWVFNDKVVWYSQQGECRNFNSQDPNIITSAGFIEFVKKITAIYPYLGSLAVFHEDSSQLVEIDSTTGFKKSDESPGGCANFNSLVFHGTDLFFYDNIKKGVFSFKQIIMGDKTLGDNVALDIQSELVSIPNYRVGEIRALSVVTRDRNEVWFLLPIADDNAHSIIMIYDYIRGEWVKRKCQKINCMAIINGTLYSAGKDIYEEYNGSTFDGEFIPSIYTCSMFNFGADNTMKITKFPPRLTVDGNTSSNFFVKYVKNYNFFKKPKVKEIKSKTSGLVLTYDNEEEMYDDKYIYIPNSINTIVKMPSATFKTLEITFYTNSNDNAFVIKNIEFSKIKVKQV